MEDEVAIPVLKVGILLRLMMVDNHQREMKEKCWNLFDRTHWNRQLSLALGADIVVVVVVVRMMKGLLSKMTMRWMDAVVMNQLMMMNVLKLGHDRRILYSMIATYYPM